MENFPKRGRPRKIPRPMAAGLDLPEVSDAMRETWAEVLRSDRSHANAYYAEIARDVVEGLSKQVQMPEDPVYAAKLRLGMDWILARRTVLSELGRMMDGEPDPAAEDVGRFQKVVWYLASRHDKLTAKAACAYIRGRRLGETKRRDRIASLHHDLNRAINEHRQRYPESTWEDVQKALGHTVSQVSRKA